MSEHGQQEGYGFPAAGLSDANEVSARHDGRDGLGLDGGRLLVAMPGYIWEKEINTNVMCQKPSVMFYTPIRSQISMERLKGIQVVLLFNGYFCYGFCHGK